MPPLREGLGCRETVELVTDYLEESLPEPRRRRFEAHTAACPRCHTYLAQMRQTIAMLGELREDSVTPRRRAELLAAFRSW